MNIESSSVGLSSQILDTPKTLDTLTDYMKDKVKPKQLSTEFFEEVQTELDLSDFATKKIAQMYRNEMGSRSIEPGLEKILSGDTKVLNL